MRRPCKISAFWERAARRRAFSLVELLVVIGLIALLIAILMPTLAKVRENANRTKCLANLMNIGQAAQQHVNEHRGYLPCGGWHWSPTGGAANPEGLNDRDRKSTRLNSSHPSISY